MPRPTNSPLADLIEKTMDKHSLATTSYSRVGDQTVDVCACGTQHPPYDDGRWATHARHQAEQIALAVIDAGPN